MALAAMKMIGTSLAADDPTVQVDVIPSMGTSGGLKALKEGAIEIAIAARGVNADERAIGLREAACLTTPFVFVSSYRGAAELSRAQLADAYAAPAPTWPDGTPLNVILRSRAGSENQFLIDKMPILRMAFDKAFKRGGVPIASTDQDNAALAQRIAGSLTSMTLVQIRAEQLNLQVLPLDGVVPSGETLAAYPLQMRLCLIVRADVAARTSKVIAHLRSPAGTALIESLGATLDR
jgi:phosphate transport system substrate-binding protein